jgi:hypothetical protein
MRRFGGRAIFWVLGKIGPRIFAIGTIKQTIGSLSSPNIFIVASRRQGLLPQTALLCFVSLLAG